MLKPFVIGALTFLVASAVVGQVIMHGQGDTTEISIRYGLLHVVSGCGVLELLRGEGRYLVPVACELVPAVISFMLFLPKRETPLPKKS